MSSSKLNDAFSNVAMLLKFGRWTFSGPDWSMYGISLHFEDINPVGKEPPQITFIIRPPWTFPSKENEVRYEIIVKIMGSDRITVRKDLRGLLPGFRWILKVYQACLKVQKMKVFL